MFLGKWNSDNSYYLYEQIKSIFYQAMGTVVFIAGVGAEVWAPPRAPRVWWCWPHGKAPKPEAGQRAAHPTRPCQTRCWEGGPGGWPSAPQRELGGFGGQWQCPPVSGCRRMSLVLPKGGEPLQCQASFLKHCTSCSDAAPDLWGQQSPLLPTHSALTA